MPLAHADPVLEVPMKSRVPGSIHPSMQPIARVIAHGAPGLSTALPLALPMVLITALFMLGACGGDSGPLTFHKDVKPIVDARCAGCHYEGGIAPFALTSFEDFEVHSGISMAAIEAGTMPPWQANNECNDYIGDRSLGDEDIQVLEDWMEAGSLEGDPANPGEPLVVERTELSRVDLELTMAEPYTPVTRSDYSDDYRCFLLEWPETETTYVTGFRAVPGADAVVHHVIAFLATPDQVGGYPGLDDADPGPGYECFGATGGPAQTWLGSWAPGNLGNDLPAGVGLEVEPGSLIVLQVHYNTLAVPAGAAIPADQTKIQMSLESSVERVGSMMPWANPLWLTGQNMRIPANDSDVSHTFGLDPNLFQGSQRLEIHGAGLHMHLLGKSASLEVVHANGERSCVLQVDEYDFDWQDGYALRQPIEVLRGDVLKLECHWDNTAGNQPVVDGEPQLPRDVFWGEGSTDEMCLGVLLVVPDP